MARSESKNLRGKAAFQCPKNKPIYTKANERDRADLENTPFDPVFVRGKKGMVNRSRRMSFKKRTGRDSGGGGETEVKPASLKKNCVTSTGPRKRNMVITLSNPMVTEPGRRGKQGLKRCLPQKTKRSRPGNDVKGWLSTQEKSL